MNIGLGILAAIAWAYLLSVLHRSGLRFWLFLVGAFGLFIFLMLYARPFFTEPLAQAVAGIAGIFGNLSGTFDTYFKYGVIFVTSPSGAMTLQIDFECSGIIEIIAYLSLLVFFRVYTPKERVLYGIIGTAFIVLSNVIRIIVICEIIHFSGASAYYVAHSLIGRLVFYALTVGLYFYVFTKPHIKNLRLGNFEYGRSN